MAEEDTFESSDITLPAFVDGSGNYFIRGSGFQDPPPPEGNPAPPEPVLDVWAEEFYELEVE
jgi:hypothetical protein